MTCTARTPGSFSAALVSIETMRPCGIVASTIREVENHTVEERALTAFTLALDQARLAIADRRNQLLKTPVPVPAWENEA